MQMHHKRCLQVDCFVDNMCMYSLATMTLPRWRSHVSLQATPEDLLPKLLRPGTAASPKLIDSDVGDVWPKKGKVEEKGSVCPERNSERECEITLKWCRGRFVRRPVECTYNLEFRASCFFEHRNEFFNDRCHRRMPEDGHFLVEKFLC